MKQRENNVATERQRLQINKSTAKEKNKIEYLIQVKAMYYFLGLKILSF